MSSEIADRFPALFQELTWGPLRCSFTVIDELPPASVISNVNLVPYTPDGWVIVKFAAGKWDMPGGTLEPGESYLDALHREVLEEVGATVVNFAALGAWICKSSAARPYRPHLPHPESVRLVGVGEVRLVAKPTAQDYGGPVQALETVTLDEARARFGSDGRPELADLYALASLRRSAI